MVTATLTSIPIIPSSRVNWTALTFIGVESRGIVTKTVLGCIFGCCTEGDVRMSSLAWTLIVTEDQRAGDTSDTDCSTHSGETQAQASASETGDCNAGPGRCERCERVLRTRAGRVTHMRLEERGSFLPSGNNLEFRGRQTSHFDRSILNGYLFKTSRRPCLMNFNERSFLNNVNKR